jgi:hypothetical protein
LRLQKVVIHDVQGDDRDANPEGSEFVSKGRGPRQQGAGESGKRWRTH